MFAAAADNRMSMHANLLRSVRAAIAASTFEPGQATACNFNSRLALTADQMLWVNQQRLIGEPSFTQLRQAMHMAGLRDVDIQPSGSRETFDFSFQLGPEVSAQTSDDLMRLLIRTFRSAGFKIGWEDLSFLGVDGEYIRGTSLTTSVNDGPPEPWQLPAGP